MSASRVTIAQNPSWAASFALLISSWSLIPASAAGLLATALNGIVVKEGCDSSSFPDEDRVYTQTSVIVCEVHQ